MRIAAIAATLLFALASCSTTNGSSTPYIKPNALMGAEISQRIEQIPFQHREELVQNLLWLAQTGEQTIPALLQGLHNDNAKVRSSCCWVLGRLRDRRTVGDLQNLVNDEESSVSMEAARSLVLMGDLEQAPKLIEGLDSDRKEVRYMCHEALKTSTGHDFGFDHLNQDQHSMQLAVLRWRQWWGEYDGDTYFASEYEKEHGLSNLAAPGGETKLPEPNAAPVKDEQPAPDTDAPKANPQPETQGTISSETTNLSAPEPVVTIGTEGSITETPQPVVTKPANSTAKPVPVPVTPVPSPVGQPPVGQPPVGEVQTGNGGGSAGGSGTGSRNQ